MSVPPFLHQAVFPPLVRAKAPYSLSVEAHKEISEANVGIKLFWFSDVGWHDSVVFPSVTFFIEHYQGKEILGGL